MATWMIYGAYGFTGQILAEEAVARGHKPILAGRSAEKLKPMAERLNLESIAVDLDDEAALAKAVANVDLVLHTAGPFVRTSDQMVKACLAAKTHYLDITGEIPVFENTFSYDKAARDQHIALISGVGFDVVPTDCMAKYIASKVPDATTLELAFDGVGGMSAGTAKSALELISQGGRARRNGKLIQVPVGQEKKKVRFSHGEYTVVSIPWGDLATGYRTTGIPNIITYLALSSPLFSLGSGLLPLVQPLTTLKSFRNVAGKIIDWTSKGPNAKARHAGRSYVWARAANAAGVETQAWLETLESYQFTAIAGIRAVEKTLGGDLSGALTPALAFGADFVLEIEGTKRLDKLGSA